MPPKRKRSSRPILPAQFCSPICLPSPTTPVSVPTTSPIAQSQTPSPIKKKKNRYDDGDASTNPSLHLQAISLSPQRERELSPQRGFAGEADLTTLPLESQEMNSPAQSIDLQPENIQPVDHDHDPTNDGGNSSIAEQDYIESNLEYFRARKVICIDKNQVRRNIVIKKEQIVFDICQCTKEDECSTNNCINRASNIECSPSCRFVHCKNQPISKGQKYRLKIFDAGNKGLGLCTLDVIPGGSFVIEYMGVIRPLHEFQKCELQYQKSGIPHLYVLIVENLLIDATLKGNEARFINHNCQPNLICQKWKVPGSSYTRVAFFAKRKIEPGEELCFNYRFDVTGKKHRCYCGAEKCEGIIGQYVDKNLDHFDEMNSLGEGSLPAAPPPLVEEEEEPSTSRRGRAIVRPKRFR